MVISEKYHISLLLFIWLLIFAMNSVAEENFISDLNDLSIEELMFVEVTSVSKKAQKLSDAPAANWQPTKKWRLLAGYSYLNLELDDNDTANLTQTESPKYQFQLRSNYDLNTQWQLDTALYFVDEITVRGVVFGENQTIDSYLRLDVRLGWRPTPNVELAIVGQNLTDKSHPEFGSVPFVVATEIERNVYVKLNWTY